MRYTVTTSNQHGNRGPNHCRNTIKRDKKEDEEDMNHT